MSSHVLSFEGLYERFNEQNDILNSHTAILRDILASQKDMVSTLGRIEKSMSPHSKSNAAEDRQE